MSPAEHDVEEVPEIAEAEEVTEAPKKKRGRPKGPPKEKPVAGERKRGRPKGSTKEKTPKPAAGEKKRGRPKGSTNKVSFKTKAQKVVKKAKATNGEKKRGRPKTKVEAENPTKFIDLVLEALKALDNKKGSSLQAVKKYIQEMNGIDPKKKAIFINKSIRKLVDDGVLRHRVGVGAKGSFKLVKKTE